MCGRTEFSQQQPRSSFCRTHFLAHTKTCSLCTRAHTHRRGCPPRSSRHQSPVTQQSPLSSHREHEATEVSPAPVEDKKPKPVLSGNIRYTPARAGTQSKYTHTCTRRQAVSQVQVTRFCLLHHKYVPTLSKRARAGTDIEKTNKPGAPLHRRRIFNTASRRLKIPSAKQRKKKQLPGYHEVPRFCSFPSCIQDFEMKKKRISLPVWPQIANSPMLNRKCIFQEEPVAAVSFRSMIVE